MSYLARRSDPGLQVSGRRAEVDQMFHSTGLQVIGLQECRSKKSRRLVGQNLKMISATRQAKLASLAFGARTVVREAGTPEVSMLCFGLSRPSGVCWRTGKAVMVATS